MKQDDKADVASRLPVVSRAMARLRDAMTPRTVPADHIFDDDWLAKRAEDVKAKRHMEGHAADVAKHLGAVKMHPMPSGEWYGVVKFNCGHVVEVSVKARRKTAKKAVINLDDQII